MTQSKAATNSNSYLQWQGLPAWVVLGHNLHHHCKEVLHRCNEALVLVWKGDKICRQDVWTCIFQGIPVHLMWIEKPFPAHLLQPLYFMLHFHLSGFGIEFTQAGGRASPPSRTFTLQLVQLQVLQLLAQVLDELWAANRPCLCSPPCKQPPLDSCKNTPWAWLRPQSRNIASSSFAHTHPLNCPRAGNGCDCQASCLRSIISLADRAQETLGHTVLKELWTLWVRDWHLLSILAAFIGLWAPFPQKHNPAIASLDVVFPSVHPVCPFFLSRASMQVICDCLVLHPSSHTHLLCGFPLLVEFQPVLPQLVHHPLVQIHLILQSQTCVLQPVRHALPLLEQTGNLRTGWQGQDTPSALQHEPIHTVGHKLPCVSGHSCL